MWHRRTITTPAPPLYCTRNTTRTATVTVILTLTHHFYFCAAAAATAASASAATAAAAASAATSVLLLLLLLLLVLVPLVLLLLVLCLHCDYDSQNPVPFTSPYPRMPAVQSAPLLRSLIDRASSRTKSNPLSRPPVGRSKVCLARSLPCPNLPRRRR